MRLFSPAVWSFMASLACLGIVAEPAGVLEVDLVFPRHETCEPTPYMPVAFGFRDGELARRLRPTISVRIRNTVNLDNFEGYLETPVTVNWTSNEPNFVYTVFQSTFATEGSWMMSWDVSWTSLRATRLSNFVMKKGGKAVDLVAITTNNETCTETLGIASLVAVDYLAFGNANKAKPAAKELSYSFTALTVAMRCFSGALSSESLRCAPKTSCSASISADN
ncbi:hypothetical protein C7999DRAFT_38120 [Corynascus novoguineensis]|uniref:DUF7136 domain-containing protein n=1 Tax=Corynascus novoguineensis TaxID=1126955 RepID=A0AAN7CZA9_9PEZI|nr:hypothetical protein C7999DRAFT_38120 [Corynascus novoguineensis]